MKYTCEYVRVSSRKSSMVLQINIYQRRSSGRQRKTCGRSGASSCTYFDGPGLAEALTHVEAEMVYFEE